MKSMHFQDCANHYLRVICIALCGVLVACQPNLPRIEALLGPQTLWVPSQASIGGAPIQVLTKAGQGQLRVYIEGDGNAFSAQGLPSLNPTPHTPVGLNLAIADTTEQPLVYLGRPCQWVSLTAACTKPVWTSERFTPEVLRDYTSLVASLAQGQEVELVGFSGGAFVAYGVGRALSNVVRVTTVAGNLNPNFINQHHRVPSLLVAPLPPLQHPLHLQMLWGARDNVIPAALGTTMAAEADASCKASHMIPGTTHVKGWVGWWNENVEMIKSICHSEALAEESRS